MSRFFSVVILINFFLQSAIGQTQLEKSANNLAKQISSSLLDKNKRKIAIVDFSYFEDKFTAFDKILTEELTTQLFLVSYNKFEIVERRLLNKILHEQKMTFSGLLEPSNSEKIGKILGVDAIVTGSVSDLIENLKVNARLVDVSTGKIFAVAAENIPKTGMIKQLYDTILGQGDPTKGNPKILKTEFSKEVEGISVTLVGCRYSSGKIVCDYELYSPNDITLFWLPCKIHDSFGNTYSARKFSIGNQTSGRYIEYLIVEGIRTKANHVIEKVTPRPEFISLLKIPITIGKSNHEISFRDIPVTK